MRIIAVALVSFILIYGCSTSPTKPDHLLPEETYINLLVEVQLLHTYQEQEQPDSATVDSLRQLIFDKYGATQQQFYKSHAYYQQDIDEQSTRLKKAIEELRKDHTLKNETASPEDSTTNKSESK